MNLIQRTMARMGLGLLKQASMGGKTMNTTDPALAKLFNQYTTSGKPVTPDTALQQSTVFTCVRIIAETVGSLPAAVYEVDGDNMTKVDHDLGDILFNSPNADMDGVEFTEAKVTNIAVGGNGYSLIGWSGTPGRSRVTSLYPLAYDSVQVKRETDGTVTYKYLDRGKWEPVPRELIWHVKGFGTNGLIGLSPVGYQREMIGMALATQEFQSKFFSNGATPSWLITIPQWLSKDQRIIARENIDKLWGGSDNAYRAQLLEGGMTAVAGTMPLQDAQFLELRQATKNDIFGMYRVPPHLGGELGRSTNNNIEHQSLDFVMHCILPYLTRLEKSISRWLMQPGDRRRFRVRWNVEGLLRADAAARGMLYSQLLQNGVLNRNEVRALEGRNRVDGPGMDDYTVQTALVPIDKLGAIADKAAAPTPAPALPQPPKHTLLVQTVNQLPEHHMEIYPPAVHTTVLAPEIKNNLPASTVVVNPAESQVTMVPDGGMKEAMAALSDAFQTLARTMAADTEIVHDEAGNPTGTRKKLT